MDNPFESLLEDKKKEVSSSPFDSLLHMDASGNKIEKQKLSLEPAEKKSIHTTPVKLTERSGRTSNTMAVFLRNSDYVNPRQLKGSSLQNG